MKYGGYVSICFSLFLGICILTMATPAMAVTTGPDASGLHWLSEITAETLQAEYGKGKDAGKLKPYLQILTEVRQAALAGDRSKMSEGMNHYLQMLASKENGISPKTATHLYDIAYEVVPARYVNSEKFRKQYEKDIEPYMAKFREEVGGGTTQ